MIWQDKEETLMVSIYVDVFLIASKEEESPASVKAALSNDYNVKDLGETKRIIGWQMTQNIEKGTLKIDQSAYIRDLLEEENLDDCKAVSTPMRDGSIIDMGEHDYYEKAELRPYQRLIGKLMYLFRPV